MISGNSVAEPLLHETGVVNGFVRSDRRARYLALLRSRRGREKLRAHLAHLKDLDSTKAFLVGAADQTPESILHVLRRGGAPEMCYVISEMTHLDARMLPLQTVLAEVVGHGFGTIVSCIPAHLGYYEGEDVGTRYILRS